MTSGGGHYSNEDKIDTIATTKGGGGERGKEVHKVKEAWRCARIETNEN